MTDNSGIRSANPLRILLKALCLFVLTNALFAAINPPIGSLLLFNHAIPGFRRFPLIWATAEKAAPKEITDIDLLFGTHIVKLPKQDDEFRVFLLGDSSTWGSYLEPKETAEAQLNEMNLMDCSGRRVVVYNLGFNWPRATKDILILSEAVNYEPDMVIWSFSLINFDSTRKPVDIISDNPERVYDLMDKYGVRLAEKKPQMPAETLWDRTLIGRRQQLGLAAELHFSAIGLFLLGTDDPSTFGPVADVNLMAVPDDQDYLGYKPPFSISDTLYLDSIFVAKTLVGKTPLVLVNEPIFIKSNGTPLRYNAVYPRWAYDQYRVLMQNLANEQNWTYYDLWNIVPPEEFSDTWAHRRPTGERIVADELARIILAQLCQQP